MHAAAKEPREGGYLSALTTKRGNKMAALTDINCLRRRAARRGGLREVGGEEFKESWPGSRDEFSWRCTWWLRLGCEAGTEAPLIAPPPPFPMARLSPRRASDFPVVPQGSIIWDETRTTAQAARPPKKEREPNELPENLTSSTNSLKAMAGRDNEAGKRLNKRESAARGKGKGRGHKKLRVATNRRPGGSLSWSK